MNPGYRQKAREALKRAKTELNSGEQQRLPYAALELRFSMESITYDRALAFRKELSPDKFDVWQPRDLMKQLHDLDPSLGLNCTVSVGTEDTPGIQASPEKMTTLGTDVVLTLKTLKDYYDRLGSFLHMPTYKQMVSGKALDYDKLRKSCEDLVVILENVLSASIFNVTIGLFVHLKCCRCHSDFARRRPSPSLNFEAKCLHCRAPHDVFINEDEYGKETVSYVSSKVKTPCTCGAFIRIWLDELKPDTRVECDKCREKFVIGLALTPLPST